MSKYGDDGYFDLDRKESLPFLLYILFCNDFEEYHESQNLSLHYKNIIEKVGNNSKNSAFLKKVIKKLVSKKVKNLTKAKVDTLEFDSLVSDSIDPSKVYSSSIEVLEDNIKKENLEARIANFKKDKLSREEFEKLSKREPLWNICRAILYICGYKGFENINDNYERISSF